MKTNVYIALSPRAPQRVRGNTPYLPCNGWNLIEERIAYNNGNNSTFRYYWGKDLSGTLQGAGGVGGLLYLTISTSNIEHQTSNSQLYIPCYDNNGNVTRYLDANGATVFKYGGRICFVVGVGMSAVDIYRADNRVRGSVRQIGGWSAGVLGGKYGASLGASGGMSIAVALGQLGPQIATPEELVTVPVLGFVGGVGGGIVGGITGFFFGAKVAEKAYDWVFTPLEKEEWEVGCEQK